MAIEHLNQQIEDVMSNNHYEGEQETFLIFYSTLIEKLYNDKLLQEPADKVEQFAANLNVSLGMIRDDPYPLLDNTSDSVKETISKRYAAKEIDNFVMTRFAKLTAILNYLVPFMTQFQKSEEKYQRIMEHAKPLYNAKELSNYFSQRFTSNILNLQIPNIPAQSTISKIRHGKFEIGALIQDNIQDYNFLMLQNRDHLTEKNMSGLQEMLSDISSTIKKWQSNYEEKSPQSEYANQLLKIIILEQNNFAAFVLNNHEKQLRNTSPELTASTRSPSPSSIFTDSPGYASSSSSSPISPESDSDFNWNVSPTKSRVSSTAAMISSNKGLLTGVQQIANGIAASMPENIKPVEEKNPSTPSTKPKIDAEQVLEVSPPKKRF
ncbi:MAG: hypothetical protein P4M12_05650 [Gammaproteobacteria bacterium]|nr:hypothetical protein [Gammaproteobacteria bacterium]